MSTKIKNIIICVLFCAVTAGLGIANIIVSDSDISYAERRELLQTPSFSSEKLQNGELFEEYEDYFLDQFVLRDKFRFMKSLGNYYVLGLNDCNDIYVYDGKVYKIDYPLNGKSIVNAANKINEINEKYLKDKNVFYSVIPDKNYFSAKKSGHLCIDFHEAENILSDNIDKNIGYIDIGSLLEADDYYNTDLHWKQQNITDISELLLTVMNGESKNNQNYVSYVKAPFYGAYYGQAALPLSPDEMTYLTDDIINDVKVYDYNGNLLGGVYDESAFGSVDSYNLFLYGAQSVLTLDNPSCESGEELIIFRDSFASSLSPLLVSAYSKITLVDLRYISSTALESYVDFENADDVLFMYGMQVLNNSYMLK